MLIDKVFKRKVSRYSNGTALLVTFPKEIKELIDLQSSQVVEISYDENKKELYMKVKDVADIFDEGIYNRKIISINEQLGVTIPIGVAKKLGIDANTFVDMDGNLDNKEFHLQVSGKDLSKVDEVENNE